MLKTDSDVMVAMTDVHQIKLVDETSDSHEYQKFYDSFQCQDEVYKRGDTMYIKHFEDKDKLCILEILMIWEVKCHTFVSARVYYKVADTCESESGEEYGEEEVVCLQREVVMSCSEFLNHIKFTGNNVDEEVPVKVVSYSAYCRQAAVKARLGESLSEYLSHPLFRAYGGLEPQYKILYCRDTVNDRNLKKLWKVQSYYRMKEMVLSDMSNKRQTKRQKLSESESSDNGDNQLCNAVEEEEDFLINLFTFLRRKGISISRLPTIGNKRVPLRELFRYVLKLGGYEGVTQKRMWRKVFLEIGGSATYTGATTSTRKQYERFLLPYEQHLRRQLKDPQPDPQPEPQTNGAAPPAIPLPEQMKALPPQPRQIAPKVAPSKVPASLLSNITNIKLPFNFIPSDATPDQLDVLIRSLSENITRAKSTLQQADTNQQLADLGPMYRQHIQQQAHVQAATSHIQLQQAPTVTNFINSNNKPTRSYQSSSNRTTGQVTQSTRNALQNSILNSKKNSESARRSLSLEEQLRELAAHLKIPEPGMSSQSSHPQATPVNDITGQIGLQNFLKSLNADSQSIMSNARQSQPTLSFNPPPPPSQQKVNTPLNNLALLSQLLQTNPAQSPTPTPPPSQDITPDLLNSLSKEELIQLISAQGLINKDK